FPAVGGEKKRGDKKGHLRVCLPAPPTSIPPRKGGRGAPPPHHLSSGRLSRPNSKPETRDSKLSRSETTPPESQRSPASPLPARCDRRGREPDCLERRG